MNDQPSATTAGTAWDIMTAGQARVARRVLHEESLRRSHLVVSLSGAHAYGFPSPDSDLDIKAVHAEPLERWLWDFRLDAQGWR